MIPVFKPQWREKIAIWIAWHLPSRVVLWCFIRVHSLSGIAPGEEYKEAHDRWCAKYGIKP